MKKRVYVNSSFILIKNSNLGNEITGLGGGGMAQKKQLAEKLEETISHIKCI